MGTLREEWIPLPSSQMGEAPHQRQRSESVSEEAGKGLCLKYG